MVINGWAYSRNELKKKRVKGVVLQFKSQQDHLEGLLALLPGFLIQKASEEPNNLHF